MSTLQQTVTRSPGGAPPAEAGPTTRQRLGAAERRLRVILEHSVNAPLAFDLSAEEADALRGRTLSEAIDALLERTDPLTATTIRETLADRAALVEVQQETGPRPARLDERIDPLIEQGEVSLGVSRAMRGGGAE